jgi:hypothetical protein
MRRCCTGCPLPLLPNSHDRLLIVQSQREKADCSSLQGCSSLISNKYFSSIMTEYTYEGYIFIYFS